MPSRMIYLNDELDEKFKEEKNKSALIAKLLIKHYGNKKLTTDDMIKEIDKENKNEEEKEITKNKMRENQKKYLMNKGIENPTEEQIDKEMEILEKISESIKKKREEM